MLGSDEAPLDRFVLAQNDVWDQVMSEIVSGRKQTHWMWFVFPQLAVLGRSEKSRFYGIRNRREAQDYLADPILGARLRDAAETLLFSARGTAEEVLGDVDALKLKSCATLFGVVSQDAMWSDILIRFFEGRADVLTLSHLQEEPGLSRVENVPET